MRRLGVLEWVQEGSRACQRPGGLPLLVLTWFSGWRLAVSAHVPWAGIRPTPRNAEGAQSEGRP